MLIPAWMVSLFAFLTAWALWLVRPMPLRIRVSLMIPFVYFGLLYLWVQSVPMAVAMRTELVRIGNLLIFLSIISNSAIVRWKWSKRRWL
jgi:hypothetical protein